MSTGPRLPHADAMRIAKKVLRKLDRVTERALIAGSLRRARPHVGDLEIVAEPKTGADLFGAADPQVEPIRRVLDTFGVVTKAGQRFLQCRSVFGSVLTLDLFLVHPPAEWGSTLAIRTGPAELNMEIMVRFRQRGYRHRRGHLERYVPDGMGAWALVPTPTESEYFEAAGLPMIAPAERDNWRAYAGAVTP